MQTAVQNQTQQKEKPAMAYPEPKRLSKFALWRRANPNGVFTVTDWKAVNK